MTKDQAYQLIKKIKQKINTFSFAYYQKGESPISDHSFDLLLKQLERLEQAFPEFVTEDSPTQQVGENVSKVFPTVFHKTPMLSLKNTYYKNDFLNWHQTLLHSSQQKKITLLCELKIDGIAISILYKNGILSQAITRGDGEKGDDITENVKMIRTLPLELKEKVSITIRGEIVLHKKQFKELNLRREKEALSRFKNPRNAASGSLRLHSTEEVRARKLDLYCYDIVSGQPFNEHQKNLDYLSSLGFQVTSKYQLCTNEQETIRFCDHWEKNRDQIPFDIDGIVIKINDLTLREKLGATSKAPRWAIAWKFSTEQKKSKLLWVENSIGRTGILTPIAHLEPIELLGTTVKRATLHNYAQIKRLGIHEEDTVYLEKGGEIIPKVIGVDLSNRKNNSKPLLVPQKCPSCKTDLVQTDPTLTQQKCINDYCPAIIERKVEHFVSKKGMNIDHLGGAIIKEFLANHLLQSIPDLYYLKEKKDLLLEKEGWGEKSVNNLVKALEQSKSVPLNRFIFALGIPNIGEKAAKTLTQVVTTPHNLFTVTEEQLEKLNDFGPTIIKEYITWKESKTNQDLVDKLLAFGVTPKTVSYPEASNKQKTIVITGTLSKSREEWKDELEKNGWSVSSALSKKTDYLLAGNNPGSKITKAKKLGTTILSESEILELLKGKST